MSTIQIYGASDDLIEIEGNCPGCDEYNAEDAAFLVSGDYNGTPARAKVRVIYNADGVWAITVSQAAEGDSLLPCVIETGAPAGYSAVASFDDVDRVDRIVL